MGITAVKNSGTEVVQLLRENEHHAVATDLEATLAHLGSSGNTLEALSKIESMCHVKWLGDLYIKNLELNAWYSRIEQLRKACAKAARQFGEGCC